MKTEVCFRSQLVTRKLTLLSVGEIGDGPASVMAIDVAINSLNLAQETMRTTSVNHVFGSVATVLTTVRVSPSPFCNEMYQAHT